MSEKVYAVYDDYHDGPSLREAPILQRTAKRIVIERNHAAFGFRTHLSPSEVSWTPLDAWDRYINRAAAKADLARQALDLARTNLFKAVQARDALTQ